MAIESNPALLQHEHQGYINRRNNQLEDHYRRNKSKIVQPPPTTPRLLTIDTTTTTNLLARTRGLSNASSSNSATPIHSPVFKNLLSPHEIHSPMATPVLTAVEPGREYVMR